MNEHFIKNIEIKNFKCFKDFKAEGLGRVNLIGGKNNAGKTAFMEAVLLTNQLQYSLKNFIIALLSTEEMRSPLRPVNKNRYREILQNLSTIKLNDEKNNDIEIIYDSNTLKDSVIYNGEKQDISEKNLEVAFKKYISSFVTPCMLNNGRAELLYDGVKRNRKRGNLNSFIQKFDNDLSEVDTIGNTFKIFSDSRNKWVDISEYGEGIKHFVSYVSVVLGYKDTIVYLDEIENGIHYTNLDKLWEIILTISKEQKVQIFATTHSKECIESYARVAKKLEETDIKFLSLYRDREDELKSITLDYQKIQDRIELGLDNR